MLKQSKQLTLFEEKITTLETNNKKLSATVTNLSIEVFNLKKVVNWREQQVHGHCALQSYSGPAGPLQLAHENGK